MVPPLMGLSLQVQGSIFDSFRLLHGVELEISIQLLNPSSSCAFVRPIKGRDSQLPNLPLEIKIIPSPVEVSGSIPVLDSTKIL